MEEFVNVLPASGSVTFDEAKALWRDADLIVAQYRRAQKMGLIRLFLTESGEHRVTRATNPAQPGEIERN